MGVLNRTLNKAVLGTKKSDGELMLDAVSVEKGASVDKTKMIALNASSEICSVIPNFIAAGSAFKAKEVLNSGDVYKIVLKDGLSMDSVKKFFTNSDGKMITSYHDVNGNFNQAGLEKVNSELSKPINSAGFAVAVASVMQVLSVAVGEYYRCEINNKLEGIQNDIRDIKQFLADEKSGYISAAIETLNKYMQDMSAALTPVQVQSYSNEVQRILTDSRALRDFAQLRLSEISEQINSSKKIKKNDLQGLTDNIRLYLSWYEDAVKLIIYGELVFSLLGGNRETMKNSISDVNNYADIWRDINISLQSALNGKEVSGAFAKQEKLELNNLSSFINSNINNNVLVEETKLLVSNNMMYFDRTELYYQDGKIYIPKYENAIA